MKKEKILDFINYLILCISLILGAMYIGTPLKNNTEIINIIVVLTTIYFILCKIVKYEVTIIPKNKSYIVLLLSSIIPIICSTYASVEGAVEYVLRYTTAICIYLLANNLKNKKYKENLINLLIISGIIIYFIALDIANLKITASFLKAINSQIGDGTQVFCGTFGYANSFAVYLGVLIILCIGKYLNSNHKYIKVLYASIIYIFLTGIILSQSIAGLGILGIITMLYIILIKDKLKRIKIIEVMVISLIVSMFTIKIYKTAITDYNYIIGYIISFVFIIPQYIIMHMLKYIEPFLYKVTKKQIIISSIIISVCIITYILIALNITEPIVFRKQQKQLEKDIRNIEKCKTYKIDITMKSTVTRDTLQPYRVIVKERDKYNDTLNSIGKNFAEFDGTYTVELTTSEETEYITIAFLSLNNVTAKEMIINEIKINDVAIPLKYKYIPDNIAQLLTDFNLDKKSITDRITYITDGLKLASQNILFGIGGDGWKYRQVEIQGYNYFANEVHSYIVEVLLEFGIFGLIGLIGILVELLYDAIKNIKNFNDDNQFMLNIFLVILLIFSHSIIDFNMSFMYIMIIVFMLLGFITSNKTQKEKIKIDKILDALFIVFLIIISTININRLLAKTIKVENDLSKYDRRIELAPYIYEYKKDKIEFLYESGDEKQLINLYKSILKDEPYKDNIYILSDMLNFISEDNIQDIEFIVERLKTIHYSFDVKNTILKNELMIKMIQKIDYIGEKNDKTEEIKQNIQKLFIDEYEKNKQMILDTNRNRIEEEEKQEYLMQLEEQKEKINNQT